MEQGTENQRRLFTSLEIYPLVLKDKDKTKRGVSTRCTAQVEAATMNTLKAEGSSTLSLPEGSYIYSISASTPGSFAAISSDDSLRTFDARSLKLLSVPATKTHEGVTCLKEYGHATEGGPQLLATAGRDGKVRLWDVRSGPGKSQPVVEMETGKFDCCYIERFTMTWIGLVVSLSSRVFSGSAEISIEFVLTTWTSEKCSCVITCLLCWNEHYRCRYRVGILPGSSSILVSSLFRPMFLYEE